MNRRALEGIRVVEFGDQFTQYAGKLLADMGAEVIKVEPSEGVASRKVGPFYHDEEDGNKSLHFWHYNTSKKSVTLDVTTEDGQRRLDCLLRKADVFLVDSSSEQLNSWGLGYERIAFQIPHLIYCSITPFGQSGPWANYRSNDLVQLALGGIMAVTGYDDVEDAPPIAPAGGQSNHLAGYFGAMGIVSSLLFKEFTGEGQYLDISVHESVTVSTEMSIPYWVYQQAPVIRQTGRHALPKRSVRWNLRCKDGKYMLCLNTYISAKRWRELVAWLASHGLEGDLADEKYVVDAYRASHMSHVCEVLEKFCSQFDSNYIFHTAQKIGLPWAPIRAPEEMLEDEHLTEDRKVFVSVDHSELGTTITYPGAPYIFHGTPWEITSRPPLLGEHNCEILEWVEGDLNAR